MSVKLVRQPNGFAVELDAFTLQRLKELAQPMDKGVEPPQDRILGFPCRWILAAHKSRGAAFADMNAAGAARDFGFPALQGDHASVERVIRRPDLLEYFFIGGGQQPVFDEQVDNDRTQSLGRFEVLEGGWYGNAFGVDGRRRRGGSGCNHLDRLRGRAK